MGTVCLMEWALIFCRHGFERQTVNEHLLPPQGWCDGPAPTPAIRWRVPVKSRSVSI